MVGSCCCVGSCMEPVLVSISMTADLNRLKQMFGLMILQLKSAVFFKHRFLGYTAMLRIYITFMNILAL